MMETMNERVSALGDAIRDFDPVARQAVYKLARRMIRREHRRENQIAPVFVVVTQTTRHYGGPEEGSWWYDWISIAEVRKCWGIRQTRRIIRDLRETYPQPRFGRHSCANRGEADTTITLCASEDEFPEETKRRPRYE